MADYIVRSRLPQSLNIAETFKSYIGATWTRSAVDGGRFSITVKEDEVTAGGIAEDNIFEARREGDYEFAGVMLGRYYDATRREWTLSGPDLKGFWLNNRTIYPGAATEFDTQTGVAAETAMLHYINGHLLAPSDADRDVHGEMDVQFNTQADQVKGGTVNYSARFKPLLTVLGELARQGDLTHDVILTAGNAYEYVINARRDRTATTGASPVIFSVQGLDNIANAVYREDAQRLRNFLYVLGTGSGASRTVREVKDATSILDRFRREGSMDARDADSNDKLDQAGGVVIAQSILDTRTATMEPIVVGATDYRTSWDLGQDITVKFIDIDQQVDLRIEEVTVTLDANQGETVKVTLGRRPQTVERIIAEIAARGNPSQVA